MFRSACWPCSFRKCSRVESSWENVEAFLMWPKVAADDAIFPRQSESAESKRKSNEGKFSYDNIFAKLENLRKFIAHRVFQMFGLCLRHLTGGKIENFLTEKNRKDVQRSDRPNRTNKPEKFQNFQIVLAHRFAGFARFDNIADKIWPFLRPFVFQNLNEKSNRRSERRRIDVYLYKNNIEFIQINFFTFHQFGILRMRNDQADDVLFDR